VKLTFWGVRGSIPSPGPSTVRYGGNSSCVSIAAPGAPTLVFDGGTGARALGGSLVAQAESDDGDIRDVVLLFTHLHADHVLGFPFFAPIFAPGWRVRVGLPATDVAEVQERLGRFMNGVLHPLRLAELGRHLEYLAVQPGSPWNVGPWRVEGIRLAHPGGSVGYKVIGATASVAYLTDSQPLAPPGAGVAAGLEPTSAEARLIASITGLDVVIFDTMYEYDEYLTKMEYGHAYPEYAQALCAAAGVKVLYLFHHAPDASDDVLDARAARFAGATGPEVRVAREGETISL
jgi:phosphoribosyl 1,2-cyclic phosphodiesterase